ncbi:MAG: 6-carboxytetrahydropterin synthase [Spirochaetia bacterium]|nr:6-carboxytetrahydropterin synthase [Spirochaetia bacterium]
MKSEESYQIRVEGIFESAHYLYNYYSDGRNEELHGHTFKAEVFCLSKKLSNGISIDYYTVHKELEKIVDYLDHKCLNDIDYFKKENPTSENIAKYIYRKITEKLPENTILSEIRVWEGPKFYASFFPGT